MELDNQRKELHYEKSISAVLLSIVLCLTLTVTAFAYHYIPGRVGVPDDQKVKCNNTYYTVVHSGHISATVIGSHEHTDGRTCYITQVILKHTKRCTACDQIVGTYNKACELSHSVCGAGYTGQCY